MNRPARRLFLGISLVIPLVVAGCPLLQAPLDDGATQDVSNPIDRIEQSLDNTAPVADAGEDVSAEPGDLVRLSGTASADADGDRLTFVWVQLSGDVDVELAGAFSAIATFDAPADLSEQTTLTFSLTVTDGFGASVDQVRVVITPDE